MVVFLHVSLLREKGIVFYGKGRGVVLPYHPQDTDAVGDTGMFRETEAGSTVNTARELLILYPLSEAKALPRLYRVMRCCRQGPFAESRP